MFDQSFEQPALPKLAKSQTSMPTSKNTSSEASTLPTKQGNFNKKKDEQPDITRRGSGCSPRKPNHPSKTRASKLDLVKLMLFISLASNVSPSQAAPASADDFHLVFEEVGNMAGSTDYQLATMKVNLTQLDNGVRDLKSTIENQTLTVRNFKIHPKADQALWPTKNRLLEILTVHDEDADILHDRIKHLKNILPKISKLKAGTIDENGRSSRSTDTSPNPRNKRFIWPLVWGLIGTYRGIMTERKYEKLSENLRKTNLQVKRIVDVVNSQGKTIATLLDELDRIKVSMTTQEIMHSLNTETHLRSANIRLNAEITRISNALQAAQSQRLSIDFLTTSQLDSLYGAMIDAATISGAELLVTQPSDLLQLDLSYFYDGEMITFLLHVPSVPQGAMLRLIKLHPFPLPISGQYSILPDVENEILAISNNDLEMSLQFPSVNLLGCNQANHVYLCERVGVYNKNVTNTCLGALFKQDFARASMLCPMKIVVSGEMLYRLDNNKYLVYSPVGQTIPITCPNQNKRDQQFLREGVSEFQLSPGCKTSLTEHYVFADNSISAISGLEHIILNRALKLEIPSISPEALEVIMNKMNEDGLYKPSVNDIIEASEHLEELESKTSLIGSIVAWIIAFILFIITFAFLFYLFFYLSKIRAIFTKILNIHKRKQILSWFKTYFTTLTGNDQPSSLTQSTPSS